MKNKVVVTIADRDYTMVAVEDENYVRKCAAHVDQQLREIANSRISQADELLKSEQTAENLRRQIKDNLEEVNQLKMELSEAKREIFKLQNRK